MTDNFVCSLPTRAMGTVTCDGMTCIPQLEVFEMVLLAAFLVVLVFAGLGFALHVLWIVAVVLLLLWLVGFAVGRGESAGSRRFYRW
jgi:hypothetical protein